jgi:cell division protein FtsW
MKNWQEATQPTFDRRYLNIVKRWWIDIDKINFLLVISLIIFGLIMVASASPEVATRISTEKLFFVKKQLLFTFVAIFTITFISFFDKQKIKVLSIFGMASCLILLLLVLVLGSEAKGAKRWIMLMGFSIQPSEFAKVFFVIFNAFLLQKLRNFKWIIQYGSSASLYLMMVALLILQPDFGMTLVFTAIWLIQLFIFGLPLILIFVFSIIGIAGGITAYFTLPHVAGRINKFLNFNESNYQVERAVDGYVNGGFFGTGPTGGIVKQHIPDAHTDFIFAVVAEEFGLITCLFLMVIFAFIITRVIRSALQEHDLFSKLAIVGLISQIALQTLINIGVSIGMLPTKGMTMPFISYGGSSLVAVSIGFGIILALTRKKYHDKINYDNVTMI